MREQLSSGHLRNLQADVTPGRLCAATGKRAVMNLIRKGVGFFKANKERHLCSSPNQQAMLLNSDIILLMGQLTLKGEFGQEMTSYSISTGAMFCAPFLALLGRTNPSAVPDMTFLSGQASLFLAGLLLHKVAQV